MAEWIYVSHPRRDEFAATMTDEEGRVWDTHRERLVAPTRGPHNTGICVPEARDEASAQAFMAEDPAIASGIGRGELRPFRVSLLRGRD